MDWDRTKPVTSDFEDMLASLGAISFDLEGDTEKRPDYAVFDDRLLIEIKTLSVSVAERSKNPADQLQQEILKQPNKTLFFGLADAEAIIRAHNDPRRARATLLRAAAKSALDHMGKAAVQFRAVITRQPYRYARSTTMMVLINEGFKEYSPEVMVDQLNREVIRSRARKSPRYGLLDVVLYISMYHLDERDTRQVFNLPAIVFAMRPEDQRRALGYAQSVARHWSDHVGLIYGGKGRDPRGLRTIPSREWRPNKP